MEDSLATAASPTTTAKTKAPGATPGAFFAFGFAGARQSQFASGDQVMFTYDFVCQEPIGNCRTAELLTFKSGLISRSELFFDTAPFAKAAKP
ncbi:MAG: hypothetical protein M1482_04950 [Chloroflexi bacterium]|nr:hypothetical protein [Chloroflexota bacterium]